MKINGLTVNVLISDEESPAIDIESALLSWLLSEWHNRENVVDSKNNLDDSHPCQDQKTA
jgi:hypothetical protein